MMVFKFLLRSNLYPYMINAVYLDCFNQSLGIPKAGRAGVAKISRGLNT